MSQSHKDTDNNRGYMHPPSSVSTAFVEFSKTCELPVLDIGAAHGVATIPALEAGAKVVALDMEQKHLDGLLEGTPDSVRENLKTQLGQFPASFDFEENSFGAVLASHLLAFLTNDEWKEGFAKIHKWLAPGGKVFFLSYSPYNNGLGKFVPEFEKRLAEGHPAPGFVEDVPKYATNPEIMKKLPSKLNHPDIDTMNRMLGEAGFKIDVNEYTPLEYTSDPRFAAIQLDGREWIRVIATKP